MSETENRNLDFKFLTPESYGFPINLLEVSNPPSVYVRGDYDNNLDCRAVAIIGSRNMTEEGKKNAGIFAYELARRGITIISGGARGIDTEAHKFALLAPNGRTVVVLGSGIDVFYPKENSRMFNQIVNEKRGAIITRFKPGTPPYATNFPIRNEDVSGLAKVILVIEGQEKSGTLLTVKAGLDQGREIFVLPGSPLATKLVDDGATIAKSSDQIVKYVNSLF